METSPTKQKPFVVAFNRDRDFYQVPLALEEGGMLETFITDLYSSPQNERIFPSLKHRKIEGLPPSRTRNSLKALLLQVFGPRLGMKPLDLWWKVDSELGRRAANEAIRTGADLFLYSQYAYEAFTHPKLADRRRVLFWVHPHRTLIVNTLAEDQERFPEFAWAVKENVQEERKQVREDVELERADLIFCASSFTKRSLLCAGKAAETIHVAPYGATPQKSFSVPRTGPECRFLFVGQGRQRKGLHHLLMAWKRLALPNATLTLICSHLDAALQPHVTPDIRVRSNIPKNELNAEFANAHVFIMPSLVEGFGLVYLEALAAGCYVIGTENTGLPDLGVPPDLASVVDAGGMEQMMQALEGAYQRHFREGLPHAEIEKFSDELRWSGFRERIREGLAASLVSAGS
ncbi:glycosyltransferase family 4 protein [Granulicella sp. WH15]|uniref:glycosyltransferase family 4 protein n=1 Tax=Granulicella sp. WH15 TaxID=2602070 RepID=UPI0013A56020|nr:glycosyltransferase family 4 protein [Granulicella sp. WH15]